MLGCCFRPVAGWIAEAEAEHVLPPSCCVVRSDSLVEALAACCTSPAMPEAHGEHYVHGRGVDTEEVHKSQLLWHEPVVVLAFGTPAKLAAIG